MGRTRALILTPIILSLLQSVPREACGGFNLTTVAALGVPNGSNPFGGVTLDNQGNIYGTTEAGGSDNDGTVFKITAGTSNVSTIVNFSGTNGDEPFAGLTLDAQGNIYGTTMAGGSSNLGTVFRIDALTGSLSTLTSFNGTNGSSPLAGVTIDAQGNIYGTTYSGGGMYGRGTVYEIAAGTNVLTTLATFDGNTNGGYPIGGLVLDAKGNLYGTTSQGTAGGGGSLFQIAAGTGVLTTLATFGGGTMGAQPTGNLTIDAQGNIFGTTYKPTGGNVNGTVFELAASGGPIMTLATFPGSYGTMPYGGVTLDGQGNIFGVASNGGPNGAGTVFEITAGSGSISTLVSFDGANGDSPLGSLTIDSQGDLFGTTSGGGADNGGTVFELLNSAVVPEPASILALAQAACILGAAMTTRARWLRA